MASTGTVAVAVGSTAAAITFAVVSIVGAASPRPDLGGPVIVEAPVDPAPTAGIEDDGVVGADAE